MKNLTAVVIGYGGRSSNYSKLLLKLSPDAKVAAVAEPIEARRYDAKKDLGLSDEQLYSDWKEIAELPKIADFAIIGTQDNMHYEPALALIEKGYNLLLEKPMAPTARECKEIAEAAERKGVEVIVCHVLRFTKFYKAIKDIIDDGTLGTVVSMECKECVGNTHQSHSFVRGNWRNTAESAPMILAKCCHDMDLIQWLLGKSCKKVQSFGSRTYFCPENRPEGAPDYCIEGCPHAAECPYNAVKLYYDDKNNHWFRGVATHHMEDRSDESVKKAITDGPYGRCVFACDNDVVDHQVVNLEFDDGCTVSFSMNAFNKGGRSIHIFGTKGELVGDMDTGKLKIFDFLTRKTSEIDTKSCGTTIVSGHGGGDGGMIQELIDYFGDGVKGKSICDARTSYENHLIAFAAEEARLRGTVIDFDKFEEEV